MNLGENSGSQWTEIPVVTPARITESPSTPGPSTSQSLNGVPPAGSPTGLPPRGPRASSTGEQPRGEQTPGELERTPSLGDPLSAPQTDTASGNRDSDAAAKYSENMQAVRTTTGPAGREAAVQRLLDFGSDNADDMDAIGVLDRLPIAALDRVATADAADDTDDTIADGDTTGGSKDDARAAADGEAMVASVAAAASPIHESHLRESAKSSLARGINWLHRGSLITAGLRAKLTLAHTQLLFGLFGIFW